METKHALEFLTKMKTAWQDALTYTGDPRLFQDYLYNENLEGGFCLFLEHHFPELKHTILSILIEDHLDYRNGSMLYSIRFWYPVPEKIVQQNSYNVSEIIDCLKLRYNHLKRTIARLQTLP